MTSFQRLSVDEVKSTTLALSVALPFIAFVILAGRNGGTGRAGIWITVTFIVLWLAFAAQMTCSPLAPRS